MGTAARAVWRRFAACKKYVLKTGCVSACKNVRGCSSMAQLSATDSKLPASRYGVSKGRQIRRNICGPVAPSQAAASSRLVSICRKPAQYSSTRNGWNADRSTSPPRRSSRCSASSTRYCGKSSACCGSSISSRHSAKTLLAARGGSSLASASPAGTFTSHCNSRLAAASRQLLRYARRNAAVKGPLSASAAAGAASQRKEKSARQGNR